MASAQIDVKITGIKNRKGKIMVALFDSGFHFPSLPYIRKTVDIASDLTAELQFTDSEEGFYAISAFHSERGQLRPQLNLLGMPTERYGFSNNIFGFFGMPPLFEQAKFEVKATTEIEISLKSVAEAVQSP